MVLHKQMQNDDLLWDKYLGNNTISLMQNYELKLHFEIPLFVHFKMILLHIFHV